MDLEGSQVVVEPNLLTEGEGDVPVIEPVAAESPPTSPHAAVAAVVVDENSNQSEPEAVGGGQVDLAAEPSYQEVNESTPPEERSQGLLEPKPVTKV